MPLTRSRGYRADRGHRRSFRGSSKGLGDAVDDVDRDLGATVDHDGDGRSGSVLERVGDPLLDHPVGDGRRRGGHLFGVAAQIQPYVEPGGFGSGGELLQRVGQARRRQGVGASTSRRVTRRPISRWAWSAASAMWSKASDADAWSVAMSFSPAYAWTTMTLTQWATMSCSSRAMRALFHFDGLFGQLLRLRFQFAGPPPRAGV